MGRETCSRRDFMKQLGLGAAGLTAAGPLFAPRAVAENKPGPPNILFIFSDQQRWDTLGCYGENMGRALGLTPNLDAMAGEGVRFSHAFTAQPVCGPTRSCLQTGLYATQTGCWQNGIPLPHDAVTLPRLLKPAGYEVGYIGKWHLAFGGGANRDFGDDPIPPDGRGGYDDFWLASDILEFTSHSYDGHMFDKDMNKVPFPKNRYRVDALTDYALNYLRTRDGKRPFFLFLSYIEPHHQNDHDHFEGPRGSKEKYKNYPVPGDLEGAKGDWQTELPDYLGCCASLDSAVGRLRAELKRLKREDNTLVIYTSDHACHFRTRNGEYKRACQDNAIHVPLVVYGPGFRGGKVADDLVSLMDLPPTIVSAGGVKPPEAMRGRALQSLMDGSARDWQDDVFVQISESQTGRAVRTSRWKYSVRAPGGSAASADSYNEDFLYDLEKDPHERNNLVRDPTLAGIRAELGERLKRRMRHAGESEPGILPAKDA